MFVSHSKCGKNKMQKRSDDDILVLIFRVAWKSKNFIGLAA
jgi:hypothetical protein